MDDIFLLCIFCSAITYGDVSYDYMPETFATSAEQRNQFTFDEEREIFVKGESNKLLGQTRPYFRIFRVSKFLTLTNNNWTSLCAQVKFISGNPKKLSIFFCDF